MDDDFDAFDSDMKAPMDTINEPSSSRSSHFPMMTIASSGNEIETSYATSTSTTRNAVEFDILRSAPKRQKSPSAKRGDEKNSSASAEIGERPLPLYIQNSKTKGLLTLIQREAGPSILAEQKLEVPPNGGKERIFLTDTRSVDMRFPGGNFIRIKKDNDSSENETHLPTMLFDYGNIRCSMAVMRLTFARTNGMISIAYIKRRELENRTEWIRIISGKQGTRTSVALNANIEDSLLSGVVFLGSEEIPNFTGKLHRKIVRRISKTIRSKVLRNVIEAGELKNQPRFPANVTRR
eukprot:CAMPEP_0114509692 /NCGR_PEP_ID=MMETSP0109-20121206/13356_1 /TAXON_ID=29199 /ORGANISM="Chlorarachnion reptans, Strain CCCM449" /LENGTH=293 /DNA_ID=CAMNT_0001688883 /DNA_START=155 /DNA_END=1036 /DNA_ORIENTATION=-